MELEKKKIEYRNIPKNLGSLHFNNFGKKYFFKYDDVKKAVSEFLNKCKKSKFYELRGNGDIHSDLTYYGYIKNLVKETFGDFEKNK